MCERQTPVWRPRTGFWESCAAIRTLLPVKIIIRIIITMIIICPSNSPNPPLQLANQATHHSNHPPLSKPNPAVCQPRHPLITTHPLHNPDFPSTHQPSSLPTKLPNAHASPLSPPPPQPSTAQDFPSTHQPSNPAVCQPSYLLSKTTHPLHNSNSPSTWQPSNPAVSQPSYLLIKGAMISEASVKHWRVNSPQRKRSPVCTQPSRWPPVEHCFHI